MERQSYPDDENYQGTIVLHSGKVVTVRPEYYKNCYKQLLSVYLRLQTVCKKVKI